MEGNSQISQVVEIFICNPGRQDTVHAVAQDKTVEQWIES